MNFNFREDRLMSPLKSSGAFFVGTSLLTSALIRSSARINNTINQAPFRKEAEKLSLKVGNRNLCRFFQV